MADLVTRLLLNSSQFDNNIRQSTQQVQQFQQVGRNITATIGKFAGALGVAMTAGEAFNKWVHSSQALGDEWDNTINACKGTIDVFFQSLSNGDWSAFQDGLFSTIKGLKELSALRDSLADAKLTMDFNTKRFEAQFTELEVIIRDKTKNLEERKKAFEQLQTLKANYKIDIVDVSAGNDQTLIKSLETQYKGHNWTTKDVEKYLSIYNNDFSSRPEKDALDEYKKRLSELESQQYSYTAYSSMYGGGTIRTENKEITKQIALFKARYAELEKMRILNNDDDKDRAQMLKDYEYSYDLRKKAADFDKRVLELQASLQEGSTNKANKTAVIPSGSIEELQSKLKGLKKSYENATSEGTRAGFMKAIKVLETELQMIQLRAGASLLSSPKNKKLAGRRVADDIKSGHIKVTPISTDSIKVNNDYADSLSAIATVMSSVTNMTNEGAAAWLSYSANIVSSVAAAIPALTSLTTALTAKAAAESAGSAAAVPVVGWINAIAAITAITAAMASVPKFADGGIIAGNSTIGDYNIARVNSGEMILNNRQQKNLFNLLDGKSGTSVNAGREVKLRIERRDLVGVLNSQTSKTSKYK